MRQAAETENLFTSVERIASMSRQTPIEKPYDVPDKKPPPNWPSEGRIVFNNVELRYRPELDPALRNLSFATKPAERIGIVGRTGSGKSSIFISLFRMVEISKGCISIDGVDTSEIGLHDLRSSMAIVPQDPMLFKGTIRSNLDPTGSYNDSQLWDVIHRVHMDHALGDTGEGINGKGCGLDVVVHEKGNNFSIGERQLLSLARVILTGVKVVVLDEASASLDNHTDMLVQKTVREHLSDRTVLTIAHRLVTVADNDRIMVMDAGEMVEFDSPSNLLRKGGYFSKLVAESGGIESAIIRATAEKASNGGEI